MTRILTEIHAPALGIALLLTACASAPPPVGLLDDADLAISVARDSRADDYAPVELGFAEEKLAAARLAMEARDYAQANALAGQAQINAELAKARSRAALGRAAVQQQSEENARLRSELLDGEAR